MKSISAILLMLAVIASTAFAARTASEGNHIEQQTTRTIRATKGITYRKRRNIRANPYKKEWGARTLNFRRKHRRIRGRRKPFDIEQKKGRK